MEGQTAERPRAVVYKEKDEATTPVGDFIAQVAAAIVAVSGFLTYYTTTNGELIKGYEQVFGIVIILVAAAAFVFASYVLVTKFIDDNHWLARSPGWAYGAASALVILLAVISVAFANEEYTINWGVPLIQLMGGVFLAIGGMLKFE